MVYDALIAPFAEFAFMRRALAGCLILSLSAGPVGVFLMLRRMSLAGDALAHAILPGVAAAYFLFGLSILPMTVGGLAAGVAVAVAAGLVSRGTALREDASLAAFYLISLAAGVLIVSVRESNTDLMHVLFGNVLALDDAALLLLAVAATVSVFTFAILLRPLVAECVDPDFLKLAGGPSLATHLGFLLLVVLNMVSGFQALGTLLAVGLMILPAASAHFWVRNLMPLLLLATGFAMASCVCGLITSYHFGVPSGPAITLSAGTVYLASLAIGPVGGLIWLALPRRHRAA